MLTETELARLIVAWKSQTGTDVRGRMCVPTDTAMRVNMYKDLIETLIVDHGYTEQDLLANNTKNAVIKASLNPKSPNKASWESLATEDWERAVSENPRWTITIRKHDSSSFDTSRRKTQPEIIKNEHVKETKTETKTETEVKEESGPDFPIPEPIPESEDLGPMILSEEEFNSLAASIKNGYDREFLAGMLDVPANKATPNQLKKLNGIRNKILKLKKLEDSKDELEENLDPRLLKDNPIDRSIFDGLPPVVCPDDEDFLEVLAKIRGDDE